MTRPHEIALSAAMAALIISSAAPDATAQGPSARRSTAAAAKAAVLQAPGHGPATEYDAELARLEMQELSNWLMSETVPEAFQAPVLVSLTKAEERLLQDPDASDPRHRVGVVKPVGIELNLSGLDDVADRQAMTLSLGALRGMVGGGHAWSAVVQSPDATALRVHFTDFRLPPQATMWVHDLNGRAAGPYTGLGPNGTGDFWTHNTMGDLLVIELRHFGSSSSAAARFTLAEVGHSGPLFAIGVGAGIADGAKALCDGNADCVNGAAGCSGVQDAIALMQFVSGPFLYTCTGGLLADTDDASIVPYFLTANHCISKNNEANSLETYFAYCGSCSGPSGGPWTLGSSIKSTNRTGDYTLLELDSTPAGRSYLGWDAYTDVANANASFLQRYSHPSGSPQAYSEHEVDTSATTCRSWPRGSWIYSRDTSGATEGGSSGAPVLNSADKVVGQLSGACGFNTGDVCDSVNNATVDGAFASYFSEISAWLDPSPCSPSPEVCDNGSDDDCDGSVDCADSDCDGDPACSGGGCQLGGNRDPCEVNADCCSNNCGNNNRCRGN